MHESFHAIHFSLEFSNYIKGLFRIAENPCKMKVPNDFLQVEVQSIFTQIKLKRMK